MPEKKHLSIFKVMIITPFIWFQDKFFWEGLGILFSVTHLHHTDHLIPLYESCHPCYNENWHKYVLLVETEVSFLVFVAQNVKLQTYSWMKWVTEQDKFTKDMNTFYVVSYEVNYGCLCIMYKTQDYRYRTTSLK